MRTANWNNFSQQKRKISCRGFHCSKENCCYWVESVFTLFIIVISHSAGPVNYSREDRTPLRWVSTAPYRKTFRKNILFIAAHVPANSHILLGAFRPVDSLRKGEWMLGNSRLVLAGKPRGMTNCVPRDSSPPLPPPPAWIMFEHSSPCNGKNPF